MDLKVTLSNIEYLKDFTQLNIKAIIVGMNQFSDRFNRYFSYFELDEIIKQAKALSIDVYVSVNAMIQEDELELLEKHLLMLKQKDIKGIYFNDFAVYNIAYENDMLSKLIYIPDTLITNSLDALFLLKQGIKSVVAAKELTLDEIVKMAKKLKNMELIIHGRINLSYSKRFFLRNYFKHIGKNKEVIDNHTLRIKEETRDTMMPIIETKYGTSIYSDMSLCSYNEFEILKRYLSAGIIDDIFMSKEELIDSINSYRLVGGKITAQDIDLYMKKRYPESNYGPCFYYEKTSKTKEGK